MAAIRTALFFFVTLAFASAAAASAYVPLEKRLSAEQLRETGLDTLTVTQLQKLNALLAADAGLPPVQKSNASHASANRPVQTERPLLGFNDKPISARLKGTLNGWQEGTVFELDNGQQWKVLKGYMILPKPLTDAPVKLVPGIAGRWFLQVSEDYPMARVYLIN
jgi:hypothetical protein